MSLKSELHSLLNNAIRLCNDCPEAEELLDNIKEMLNRLDKPLRVAVVGVMKAGKSTFMNALMGSDILDTGTLETTYTVCWFRYADKPSLTICFRDGSTKDAPFEDLQKWSVRAAAQENERLNDVKYVIVYYPSEVLRKMEFIDTPGLNSVYGTDAENTLDFLSIKSSEDTISEASEADAIIYAFSRSAQGFDKGILDSFHSGSSNNSSPINSVGILTKADITGGDIYGSQTPVETAKAVTSTIMKEPDMKKNLFSVLPVCAKTVEGYFKLSDADWSALEKIAEKDLQSLIDCLYDANMFAICTDEEYMIFGSVESRTRLMQVLDKYGILEVSKQLALGKTREEIGDILQEKCGVQPVRSILQSHFGNRTFLIKSQYIFNYLHSITSAIKKKSRYGSDIYNICEHISENLDDLMSSHQTFNELKILQMYYNEQLSFENEEEKEDFLRITGEYGRSAEDRLGMEKGSTISQLKEKAKEKVDLWHLNSSRCMQSGNYVTAATIISRSYEMMYYHLLSLDEE
ncbi:MAG: dynamin family protein [Ruminococcus sp.]